METETKDKKQKTIFSKRTLEYRKQTYLKDTQQRPTGSAIVFELQDHDNKLIQKRIVSDPKININQLRTRMAISFKLNSKDLTSALIVKGNNYMLNNNSIVGQVYQKYKNKQDGWLYLKLKPSNAF